MRALGDEDETYLDAVVMGVRFVRRIADAINARWPGAAYADNPTIVSQLSPTS